MVQLQVAYSFSCVYCASARDHISCTVFAAHFLLHVVCFVEHIASAITTLSAQGDGEVKYILEWKMNAFPRLQGTYSSHRTPLVGNWARDKTNIFFSVYYNITELISSYTFPAIRFYTLTRSTPCPAEGCLVQHQSYVCS